MVNNSPKYGPSGYGNNKMPRWMRLLLESMQKNVVRTPNSHPLKPTGKFHKVKAKPRSSSR
jgi:hypothetical protein